MNKQQIIVISSTIIFLYIITTITIPAWLKVGYIVCGWVIGTLYFNNNIKEARVKGGHLWIKHIPIWVPFTILIMPIILPLALVVVFMPGDPFKSKGHPTNR